MRKSPDEAENLYAYTSKRDMWYAGVLLAQMIWGQKVVWKLYTPATLLQQGGSLCPSSVLTQLIVRNGLGRVGCSSERPTRAEPQEAIACNRGSADVTKRGGDYQDSHTTFKFVAYQHFAPVS